MTERFQVASRAAVAPFHVMDLLAAGETRQRTHGDLLNLLAGQPSTGAPATGQGRGDPPAQLRRPTRLHPRHRHPPAARGDRPTPPARPRARHQPRRSGRHDRVQRRVPAGLPRCVRAWRSRRHRPPRLPLLPQRPDRAGLRGRGDPDRARRPVSNRPSSRSTEIAETGPRRPARSGRGQPGQPDRHDAAACRARRAGDLVRGERRPAHLRRALPRHRVRPAARRERPWRAPHGRPAARPSSSTRSRSTSR